MLNKRELSTVDIPTPPAAVTIPQKVSPDLPNEDYQYFCVAQIVNDVENHRNLAVTVWENESRNLVCRVFFDRKTKTFCTQRFSEKEPRGKYGKPNKPKWCESTLASLLCSWRGEHIYGRLTCALDGSEEIIRDYIGDGITDAVSQLENFQSRIRECQLKLRVANRKKAVDAVMSLVGELPDDWNSFIVDYAMRHSRYIIYTREKRKQIIGYCTHCKKTVTLDKAKHNTLGVCPACDSTVRLKSAGITHYLSDQAYADYIQPAPNGALFIRSYEVYWKYSSDGRKREQHLWERRRYYFDSSEKWHMYDTWDGWRERKGMDYFSNILYPHNVKEVLSNTRYKYSAAEVMATACEQFCEVAYFQLYDQRPCLEYFPKLGLYRIAAELAMNPRGNNEVVKLNAKTPDKIIPFSKSEIRRFSRQNVNLYELQTYADYKAAGYDLTEEALQTFRDYNAPADKLLHNGCNADPFKLLEYLRNQAKGGYNFDTIFRIWKDYITSAKSVHLDLSDDYYLYPKDAVAAHDELEVRAKSAQVPKQYYAMFLERAEEYEPLRYEDDNFIIRVPQSVGELVYNGMKMHICVGNPIHGYIQAHAEKRKMLFFVRRKEAPDIPFVTLEMSMAGKLGQISAYKNLPVTSAVNSFLMKWQKAIVKKEIQRKEALLRVRVAV